MATDRTDALEESLLRALARQGELDNALKDLRVASRNLLDDELTRLDRQAALKQRRAELLAGAGLDSPLISGRNEAIRSAELDTLTREELDQLYEAERNVTARRSIFEQDEAALSVARHKAALEVAILGALRPGTGT